MEPYANSTPPYEDNADHKEPQKSANASAIPSSGQELFNNPVINILKTTGRDDLFIAAICALALLAVTSLICGIVDTFTNHNTGYFLLALSFVIPEILICVGLSMFAYACRRDDDNLNTFSLKFLRVAAIVFLIFRILFRIFDMNYFGVVLDDFPYYVISILNVLLMITYCAKCYKALQGIEKMINTGIPEVCISNFIIVMNFFIVFFSVFDVITYRLSIYILLFEIVFLIFFTIILYSLRKDLEITEIPHTPT